MYCVLWTAGHLWWAWPEPKLGLINKPAEFILSRQAKRAKSVSKYPAEQKWEFWLGFLKVLFQEAS